MTLPRVESEFGNSSCSSMASFMSGLLQENFGKSEVSFAQIQIEIVDDNAKVEIERIGDMHRSRSLVTMRRQRSGRQLSRWACTYQRKDSDPNLMMRATTSRRAPRGSSTKMLTTTSDSMLLNLPTRTISPKITKSGKTLMSSTNGNATWSNADVEKSTHRVERSQLFDLSLDLSPEDEKSKLNPNPFLIDRLSSMSLIDERSSCMPPQDKLDRGPSGNLRCDSHPIESVGIRKPMRRPSVQQTTYHDEDDVDDDDDDQVTRNQQQNSKFEDMLLSASALEMATVQNALNSITLSGTSSSSLNNMTRIRNPSALGIQMPNRKNRNGSSSGRLVPENQLSLSKHKQKSSHSHSASNMSSSGMRRKSSSSSSSSSKGLALATFQDSLRRASSKSLDGNMFLNDPSLVGLKVNMGR